MRTHTSVRKNTQLLLVSPFTSSIFLRTFNIPHIQHQYKIHANIYYVCTNEQKLQSINIDAYQDTASAKNYNMWNRPKQTTAKRKPHQQPDQPCTDENEGGKETKENKRGVQLIPNLLTPSHPTCSVENLIHLCVCLLCWDGGFGVFFVCACVVFFMCVCFNFVFMDTC